MPTVDVYCRHCGQPHDEEWSDEDISQMRLTGTYPVTGECNPPCEQLKAFEERLDQEVWERTRHG